MQLSTPIFVFVFLPMFFIFYFIVSEDRKRMVLFVFSVIFYAWSGIVGLIFILISVLITFFLCIVMEKKTYSVRRILTLFGLVYNVGILCLFKYLTPYFLGGVPTSGHSVSLLITLINMNYSPLGISFYTFSVVSYLMDVYWEKTSPTHDFLEFATFILMFPKVIMGPIMRWEDYKKQVLFTTTSIDQKSSGIIRIIKGLFKKVVIADVLQIYVSYIWGLTEFDSFSAWTGIVCFMLQLYYDFSGYCDIGIGIGMIIGVVIPENFDHPYISQTVTEYWHRWHATLGIWLKDYIYTPVFRLLSTGKKELSIYVCDIISLFVVWTIAGIWHGFGITFFIYGMWYFLIISMERTYLYWRKKLKKQGIILPKQELWFRCVQRIITIIAIIVGTAIFKCSDMTQLFKFVKALLFISNAEHQYSLLEFSPNIVITMIMGIVFIFPTYRYITSFILKQPSWMVNMIRVICFFILFGGFLWTIVYMSSAGNAPFLYEVY